MNNIRKRDQLIDEMIHQKGRVTPHDQAILDLLAQNEETYKAMHLDMDHLLEQFKEMEADVKDKDTLLKQLDG